MSKYKFNKHQLNWLKALESGRRKQAREYLQVGGGYCCLGVACRVAGLRGELGGTYPPPTVLIKMRLSYKGQLSLVLMKDTEGKTFKELAAFIRANPEKVFK